MEGLDRRQDRDISDVSPDSFLIMLALIAVAAGGLLIYLLNYNLGNAGDFVIVAGLAGVVGSSLSPLLARAAEKGLQGTAEGGLSPRIFTFLFVYLLGGFGVSSVAFVLTSALLLDEPGRAASDLGTAAFGGVIGFFVGREINRRSLDWIGSTSEALPAVVTALGRFEDQLLGQPLLNYDGHIVANWRPSARSSATLGRLLVYMVAREPLEQDPLDRGSDETASTDSVQVSLSEKGRVLVQGGRDAELVPFAVSIVCATLDVHPQRLILAAPSKGRSETLVFTLLPLQQRRDEPSVGEWASSRPSTVPLYVDISQAGRTIQLFDVEIPIHGRDQ